MGKIIELGSRREIIPEIILPEPEPEEIIEGFDLDGTLYGRELVTEYWGAMLGRAFPYKLPPYTLENLPQLDRIPKNNQFHNPLSFFFHMRRQVIPGIKERLDRKHAQGITLFGISGRPNTSDWLYGSYCQRREADLPLEKIILTPKGIKGSVSKAEAIEAHNIRRFADDDLRVILYLSDLFPEKNFDYIMHQPTNIPINESDLAQRPNIRVVPLADWMNPDFD